ncbi:MAG: HEAT repeat domain-containing protein, partial [Kiritimatiellia bacterium]
IKLVATGAFTNGWRAAELLGQRRVNAALPALRQALHTDDPFLRGKSMVALARMRDSASCATIRNIFSQNDNPRIAIHGAQALEQLRTPDDLRRILVKCAERAWPEAVLDEMLLAAAGICGIKTPFFRELRAGMQQPDEGRQIITKAITAPDLRLAAEHFLQSQITGKLPEHLLLLLRMCGARRSD